MKRKTVTLYCVNERTNEIIPYTVNEDFSTVWPKGVLLTYQDNFVAGFNNVAAAREWIKRIRRPALTYRDLEMAR